MTTQHDPDGIEPGQTSVAHQYQNPEEAAEQLMDEVLGTIRPRIQTTPEDQ